MKQLFLLIGLAPATSWAQEQLPPKVVQPAPPLNLAQALQGTMNPRGLELATKTVLYRHLRDTLTSRPAWHLRPGDAVIIRQGQHKGWIKVVRGTRDLINFSSDTASYYMPKSGALGAKTFILL